MNLWLSAISECIKTTLNGITNSAISCFIAPTCVEPRSEIVDNPLKSGNTVCCAVISEPGNDRHAVAQGTPNVQVLQENNVSDHCCQYCGTDPHPRSSCPARHERCEFCKKPGHIRSVCRKLLRLSSPQFLSYSTIGNDQSRKPRSLEKALVPIRVNGVELTALIDTGASSSFIDQNVSRHIKLPTHACNQSITLASSNSSVNANEIATISVLELQDFQYHNAHISVLPGLCADMIIGHDILSKHHSLVVDFGGEGQDLVISTINSPDSNLESTYTCSVAAANIPPPSLFSNLSDDCHPIACKSRQYSEEDKSFIRTEVEKLLAEGIIEPSNSPWRAQVLVTKDEHHKKRMVIDYSRTINKYTYLDAYPLPRMDTMAFEVSRCRYFSAFDLKSAYHQILIPEEERPFTAFEADGGLYQSTRVPFGVTNGPSSFQRTFSALVRKHCLNGVWVYLDNVTIGGLTKEEHDENVRQFLAVVQMYGLTLNHDKTISCVQEIQMLGYCISYQKVRPDPERMKPLLNLPVPHDAKSLKRAMGLFSYYSQWVNRFSDKIRLFAQASFPISAEAVSAFETLKSDIAKSSLSCPNDHDILVVETDASDIALSATLNQNGRPIAFFARTLQPHERKHPSIEKEAAAVIEACRKWKHYLSCRRFRLLTDQQAVSFIFNPSGHGKTKNDKIERWRVEISCYDFDIQFRPGVQNVSADCLSRAICSAATQTQQNSLYKLHHGLTHPGVGRMYQFIRSRNLPYSMEDVKKMTANCRTCAIIKPQFYRPEVSHVIKSTRAFERLSIDFKGTPASSSGYNSILTIVDEYSRFPFAFPCKDLGSTTVIRHLQELFDMHGTPGYIHSDNGPAFRSQEFRDFLTSRGIGYSNSAVYNPKGNGQVERYNGIIWKGVQLALHSQGLDTRYWDKVLREVLHSVRSLVCTATNCTPHERFFNFERKTLTGHALPAWIQDNAKALVKKHVRSSKYDPCVEECEIITANPNYAEIRTASGKEQTVTL